MPEGWWCEWSAEEGRMNAQVKPSITERWESNRVKNVSGEVVELRPRFIGETPYLPDVNRDALPDELEDEVQLRFKI